MLPGISFPSRRPGITLIEMLVVMAILAILAGFVLSATFSLTRTSANVYCITTLKEIGSALRQYKVDCGAYPPPTRLEEYGYYNEKTGEVHPWDPAWDPDKPPVGWSSPSSHQGPPRAYLSQLPSSLSQLPLDEAVKRLGAFKYAGSVDTLVAQHLLKRAAICRNDIAQKPEKKVADYSTYSLLHNYVSYDGFPSPPPPPPSSLDYDNWRASLGEPYRYWWVGGHPILYTRLVASLVAANPSMAVEDATDFPLSGGLVLVDDEEIWYATKTDNPFPAPDTLSGLIRGVNGTTPAAHALAAHVNAALQTDAPLQGRDLLPPGIPTWGLYPRLMNPDAPDTTIVTRCPLHKQGARGRSNVLRLGGGVISVWDDDWIVFEKDNKYGKVVGDGIGIPYQYQPQGPGRP